MLCQEFSLTRFMTARCFIFVFLFIWNCVMTAEAGMVVGRVYFEKDSKSDTQSIFPIIAGKLLEESRQILICTVKKECNQKEKECDPKNPPQGLFQLMRREKEDHYKYKLYMSPGQYQITCDNDKCKTDVTINYGSLQKNIYFYHYGDKCQDKPFPQK